MKDKIIISVSLLLTSFGIFSQKGEIPKYVIITYQTDKNRDQHPAKDYYWIIPLDDSFKGKNDFKIFPLYLDEFSKDDINDCVHGKNINILTMNSSEDFSWGEEDNKHINNLKNILDKNSKLFFKIKKKWTNNYNEKIKVFMTPVFGEFCNSLIAPESGKLIDYKGLIYIPIKNFNLYSDFYRLKYEKDILASDFSNLIYVNRN
ncbi:hypothetical protein [Flavobacterium kingsejongi]|uniref:Uncharacterized protein n=1 Tax=Flavobacterium kingsejongi TaxID=1678728 RepID=A0A2S1LR64_9FLAO|nr:hypothetical protein [Flavobacterium kingsejongi]AWG26260.1 hypothetical protein FK004_13985 [Flavobacterium kingsejongi]